MPWLQLSFEATRDDAQRLSDALEEAGAVSVSLEGADTEPLFETDWNETTPVWKQARVLALFTEDTDISAAMQMVATLLALPAPPAYQSETLADQDWVRVWMDRWKPMRFGGKTAPAFSALPPSMAVGGKTAPAFSALPPSMAVGGSLGGAILWVVPSWLAPPDPNAANIILDPGMAFGTGTHATTAMCLEWLARNAPRDQIVIDYGCGSGILAIAALKLGAHSALGIDTDPQALTVSAENAERNGVSDRLVLFLPEAMPVEASADVVLANILAPALVALAPRLTTLTRPRGTLLLSGLLAHQADEVEAAYALDFLLERVITDDWALLVGHKRH